MCQVPPQNMFPNRIDRLLFSTQIASLWWIYSMVSLLILINPYCLTLSIDHRCSVPKGTVQRKLSKQVRI